MLASSAAPIRPIDALRIAFAGAPRTPAEAVPVGARWLAGEPAEDIFPGVAAAEAVDGVGLFRARGFVLGWTREPFVPGEVEARAEALYRRILAASGDAHLCRVWNYLPQINGHSGGLEHDRAFCAGRSLAFERAFGEKFQARLPAASAVGASGDSIDVIFAATATPPRHFENPGQVPAYRYPVEHGPRSPSFARATAVREGGAAWVFVSGTAAIKGHETVAPGQLGPQLDCTLDNLRMVGRAAGLGNTLGAGRVARRHFKVYLRHASDLAATQSRLARELLAPGDLVTYLQADICRAALVVEIEATIVAE